ncbi:MAG: ATP-binding protein [Oscillospiraceae bacterium]|jgi:AAA15 family ATPase/GTPase|nr:ATP-binding protein [Oscillospiraceae bacterium]
MLVQFSVKNFRSFKDEVTLDMRAVDGITEKSDTLHGGLLPVAALYGPNGGGKSNLLKAITYLNYLIVAPIHYTKLDSKEDGKRMIPKIDSSDVFALDKTSCDLPTEFNLVFRIGKYEYQYGIAFLHGEVLSEILRKKGLYAERASRVFERSNGKNKKIEFSAQLKKVVTNANVKANIPLLTYLGVLYDLPQINAIIAWFEGNLLFSPRDNKYLFPTDEAAEKIAVSVMRSVGIPIVGFRSDDEAGEFYTKHEVDNVEYELNFLNESDGTIRMVSLALPLSEAMRSGSRLVVDELDARLHPQLLRYIIGLFQDPEINKHGAQLIFSSHDMSTMNKNVFRRDEIWFVAKNKAESSELYSLSDFRDEHGNRPSPNAAYDKQYLAGRYGADPYLQNLIQWGQP